MFTHDWFHGEAFIQQREEAKRRCADDHFPEMEADQRPSNEEYQHFVSELDVRCLIYLRDGFSYEVKEMIDAYSKNHLTFECEPVDDHYKVGSFVVVVPYDEVIRVEVFAVHPNEKPEDVTQITGFRSPGEPVEPPSKPR